MVWKVTKDHIEEEGKVLEVNVLSRNYEESDEPKLIHPFKMFDDDDNLYYEGFSTDDSSFGPLDNYGTPNAGCTYIQYKNGFGKFETL
jgi:hypothetical protein